MIEVISKYKVPILLGAGSLGAIVLSIILLVKSTQSATPIRFSSDIASESAEIKVDVEGAVAHPGMYGLPVGSRVEDAITAAGGITRDADAETLAKTVNRAMKLVDGAKLYIPGVSSALGVSTGETAAVSINSAPLARLDTLPGVGPVTAQKIIDNRPYQTLEELVSKKAVGQALYEKIKNLITL